MKKKIAPMVPLQYVQSTLQASATDTYKTPTVFKKQTGTDGHLALFTGVLGEA